jgi:hypothetical protein
MLQQLHYLYLQQQHRRWQVVGGAAGGDGASADDGEGPLRQSRPGQARDCLLTALLTVTRLGNLTARTSGKRVRVWGVCACVCVCVWWGGVEWSGSGWDGNLEVG